MFDWMIPSNQRSKFRKQIKRKFKTINEDIKDHGLETKDNDLLKNSQN